MARTPKRLVIAPTPDESLRADRHTDWDAAQQRGSNRSGRAYLGHRVHGSTKTKRGLARAACRGRHGGDE